MQQIVEKQLGEALIGQAVNRFIAVIEALNKVQDGALSAHRSELLFTRDQALTEPLRLLKSLGQDIGISESANYQSTDKAVSAIGNVLAKHGYAFYFSLQQYRFRDGKDGFYVDFSIFKGTRSSTIDLTDVMSQVATVQSPGDLFKVKVWQGDIILHSKDGQYSGTNQLGATLTYAGNPPPYMAIVFPKNIKFHANDSSSVGISLTEHELSNYAQANEASGVIFNRLYNIKSGLSYSMNQRGNSGPASVPGVQINEAFQDLASFIHLKDKVGALSAAKLALYWGHPALDGPTNYDLTRKILRDTFQSFAFKNKIVAYSYMEYSKIILSKSQNYIGLSDAVIKAYMDQLSGALSANRKVLANKN